MLFPGMDPYLEAGGVWPGFHNRLVVYIADRLQPLLRPRYIAAVEERVYLAGPDREIIRDVWLRRVEPARPGAAGTALASADVPYIVEVPELEVHESYLTILDRQSGLGVVTVLEVVSPANKYPGPGRASYLAKQEEVRSSEAHLVEIDLLRTGNHVLSVPEWRAREIAPYEYLVCVNRDRGKRDRFELYPWILRERIPSVGIPLADTDPDVALELQDVVRQAYDAGSYRERLRYEAPCRPALSSEDQLWADEILQRSGQAT